MALKSLVLLCLVGVFLVTVNCGGDGGLTEAEVADKFSNFMDVLHDALASLTSGDFKSAVNGQEMIDNLEILLGKLTDPDQQTLVEGLIDTLNLLKSETPSLTPSPTSSSPLNDKEYVLELIAKFKTRIEEGQVISKQLSSLLKQFDGVHFDLGEDDLALLAKVLVGARQLLKTINEEITQLSQLVDASDSIGEFQVLLAKLFNGPRVAGREEYNAAMSLAGGIAVGIQQAVVAVGDGIYNAGASVVNFLSNLG